jgi:hypothetical protein
MPSSQSSLDICNVALSWLAANRITSFNDDSIEAQLCLANYAPLRDAVLEEHEWSFAIRRRKYGAVALSEGTPEENAYEGYRTKVRPDTIRVLEVRSDINFRTTDVLQWQLEEGYIISSQTPLYVRELYRNEDTISFSPAFNQALAARLASELCLPITESTRKQTVMYQLYITKLAEAKSMDGMQGRSKRIRSSWMGRSRQA